MTPNAREATRQYVPRARMLVIRYGSRQEVDAMCERQTYLESAPEYVSPPVEQDVEEMRPNCLTPWSCNGPHEIQEAA